MIATSDFRKGSTKILFRDEPWLIVDFQHVKPGKGGAFVRTKLKNLITGRVLDETFRSGEKFPEPDLEKKKMQFLYADDLAHFMDLDTYDQIELDLDVIASVKFYLQENQEYNILFFKGKPINVEPPMFMILEVKETIPGVKGDTAQGGSKPATLETGLVVSVPLFIEEGERIKIDTRDNKYIERID
ncbi:elongation factor P [Candidatus Dependentiae bacterium]|nr:elongation factor P [Candidatus Dependentiae bacterium]